MPEDSSPAFTVPGPLPTTAIMGRRYEIPVQPLFSLGHVAPMYVVAGPAVPVQHPTNIGPVDEIDPELVLDVMRREVDAEPMDGLQPVDLQRVAADAINRYTRTNLREDGFFRRILPPLAINDQPIQSAPVDKDQARKRVEDNMRTLAMEREAQEQVTIKPVTKKRKLIRD